MKRVFILTFIILIINCFNKSSILYSQTFSEESLQFNLKLSLDSGFIIKNKGFHYLLSKSLTDTSQNWLLIKDSDTIGKYYRVGNSDNYFMCLIDYSEKYTFETHILIELNSDGKLIKSERFFHGNYPICWENYYDGFNKYGDFFGIDICGTGSGYSADYLYLFKDILPQNDQNSIPINYWSSFSIGGGLSESLNSTMEFKDNYLIIHYLLENGELDDNSEFIVIKSRAFDVKYIFNDQKWVTNDSIKFKGLQINY